MTGSTGRPPVRTTRARSVRSSQPPTPHGYGPASAESRAPFEGYYYRILTRQGAHAPGGARDYIVNGHMTRGFALIAFPAKYGNSGVMTFVVNQSGIVFEKNLGPHTADIAHGITSYNPDRTWNIVTP